MIYGIYDKIDAAIQSYGKHKDLLVRYAIEEELDKIFKQGKVQIILSIYWKSDILINPTYLDLTVVANDMLTECGGVDHIYLEELYFEREENGVQIYEMHFGS